MLKELIGSQLLEFSENGFSVRTPNREIRNFVYEEDRGECCGFNRLQAELLISEEDIRNNPIITNVECDRHDDEYYDENICIITFFGEQRKIAEVNSYSSSGSGYHYGACVWVRCKETQQEEILSKW